MRKSIITLVAGLLMGIPLVGATSDKPSGLEDISFYSPDSPLFQNAQKANSLKIIPGTRSIEFDSTPDDIIFDAPEGEKLSFMRAGMTYVTFFGNVLQVPVEGLAGEAIKGNDGFFYLKDIVMNLATQSYVKGTELENGDIEIQLPQPIYYGNTSDGVVMFYTSVLEYKSFEDGSSTYVPVEENNVCRFLKNENGELEMFFDGDGTYILGVVSGDGAWSGNGNLTQLLTPFSYTLATPPESMTTERWALVSEGNGQFVNVGVDGNDMWIQGISSIHPDSWIKGTIEGDMVSFNSPQYTGTFDNYPYYYFFVAAEAEPNPEAVKRYDFTSIDALEFSYYAEKKYMKTEDAAVISTALTWVNPLDQHVAPSIKFQPDEVSLVPADPTILQVKEYLNGTSFIEFMQPMTNTEGQIIDPANLYYSIYIDGDLFTFTTDEYNLDEDMSIIPYGYTDYFTISCDGALHSIDFFMEGIDSYGVQSIYNDGTQEFRSNIVTWSDSGVDRISEEKPVSVSFFDLAGCKVSNPGKGMFIKVMKYADGSAKSLKLIK